MKYLLLTISLVLIVYPLYSIIKCLQALGDLSNYGVGVLAGGLLMLSIGVLLMSFTLKSINRKRTTK